MTPRDALAEALCDPGNLEPWEAGHDDGHMATADSILAALDAAGWTVAPKQDAAARRLVALYDEFIAGPTVILCSQIAYHQLRYRVADIMAEAEALEAGR